MPRSIELESRVARLRASLDHCLEAGPEALLELVRSYDDRPAFAALERTGEVEAYRARFAPGVLAFIAAAERATAAELLANAAAGEPASSLLRANPWGAYAGTERALAGVDLSACRSAAMVGCGPLPDSLIYLHDRTPIDKLVGLDRDEAASRTARRICERLGCDRIEFVTADGLELDYGRFDLICPSVFAMPRLGILERIASTAGPEAIVLVREPAFTGTLLFEPVLGSLPARLEVRARPRTAPGRLMLRRWLLGLRT
jgi:hypothetical protein